MGNFLTKLPPKIHTVKLSNIALDLEHQHHHPPPFPGIISGSAHATVT